MGLTSWSAVAEDGAAVSLSISEELLDELADVLPPFGLEPVEQLFEPPAFAVTVTGTGRDDAVVEASSVADDEAGAEPRVGGWYRLESELGLFAAEHLVGRVAVHAGSVVWQGRGLVLPGPSFAGKSTLCRALADRGATILSDEYAIVDPGTGLVSAWPRPVRLRRADGGLDRIPFAAPSEPVRVELVASMTYTEGQQVSLQEASRADAVMVLLANTVCARTHPEVSFQAATALVEHATAVNGWRGEAAAAADALVTRLGSGPSES